MATDWTRLDDLWRERHAAAAVDSLAAALAPPTTAGAEEEYGRHWRRARLQHFRAMQAIEANDVAAAYRYYLAGETDASQAQRLRPYEVQGNFWLGVNRLEAARHNGKLAALRALRSATELVEKAAHIDETYHFAGPVRVLGRITQFKPLLLGGTLDQAIAFYRRALQIAAHNSTTQLYLAEALLSDRHPEAAREVLHRLLADPHDADWQWEQARDKRLARGLLERMNQ